MAQNLSQGGMASKKKCTIPVTKHPTHRQVWFRSSCVAGLNPASVVCIARIENSRLRVVRDNNHTRYVVMVIESNGDTSFSGAQGNIVLHESPTNEPCLDQREEKRELRNRGH